MLSIRPDVLPPPVMAELGKLQDGIAPFATAEARRMLEAELGRRVDDVFSEFGERPIAAASLAQARAVVIEQLPLWPGACVRTGVVSWRLARYAVLAGRTTQELLCRGRQASIDILRILRQLHLIWAGHCSTIFADLLFAPLPGAVQALCDTLTNS